MVVSLCWPETSKGLDLCDDRVRVNGLLREPFHHLLRCGQLLIVLSENAGPIVGSHVITLPVDGGRVVDAEENLQDFFEGNHLCVKDELHHFGMPSRARAHRFVGG